MPTAVGDFAGRPFDGNTNASAATSAVSNGGSFGLRSCNAELQTARWAAGYAGPPAATDPRCGAARRAGVRRRSDPLPLVLRRRRVSSPPSVGYISTLRRLRGQDERRTVDVTLHGCLGQSTTQRVTSGG